MEMAEQKREKENEIEWSMENGIVFFGENNVSIKM